MRAQIIVCERLRMRCYSSRLLGIGRVSDTASVSQDFTERLPCYLSLLYVIVAVQAN